MSYTPTTTNVRKAYVRDKLPYAAGGSVAEFNRFLEAVRAEAKAEALREAVDDLTDVVDGIQSSGSPNSLWWQTGALAMRDRLKIRAEKLVTDE